MIADVITVGCVLVAASWLGIVADRQDAWSYVAMFVYFLVAGWSCLYSLSGLAATVWPFFTATLAGPALASWASSRIDPE